MTQKLKILGPYTPEHEGPYAFNGEVCVVHAVLGHQAFISRPESDEGFIARRLDIKNAEEVPQPREFWLYDDRAFTTEHAAKFYGGWSHRIIHVREVLPGEGE